MKNSTELWKLLRYACLFLVVTVGLVAIVGCGSGGGGDSSTDSTLECTDSDGDGYYAEENCGTAVDCDDTDASVHPGADEDCTNSVDDNCDGDVDCDDAECLDDPNCGTCTDSDGDGYYAGNNCGTAVDCDDTDASVNPGADEVCGDGIDNNCDGNVDEGCTGASSTIPDTGQTTCYDAAGNVLDPCPAEGEAFYGQDACYSINLPSYTKLDSNGNELADGAADWAMARDNVTGLTWEVKTDGDGAADYDNPHDADNQYTWYDSNPDTNGGDAGTSGDGTDTEDFIAALNAEEFGGYSDWRLPTIKELAYLTDLGTLNPAIDTTYFPDTMSSYYWSSTTNAHYTDYAWLVYFYFGHDNYYNKSSTYYVRAVRGGQ